jgi:hypothetical protein
MAQCITCGTELHPERAQKYDYCMAPDCQEKNAQGLTMVAVGMNKAADELMILDEQTRENLADGKFRDQRRGSFGPSAPAPGPARPANPAGRANPVGPARTPRRAQSAPRPAAKPHWTAKQERLALLYNSQGLRPDEIADKLGVSRYLATQIILAAKNRGKI